MEDFEVRMPWGEEEKPPRMSDLERFGLGSDYLTDYYGGVTGGPLSAGGGDSRPGALTRDGSWVEDPDLVFPRPVYVIGRSMFETSALPSDWPGYCNTWVDEVWLPSEWNRQTFAAHGVEPQRLQVMPQPIDTTLFNHAATAPMPLPRAHQAAPAGTASAGTASAGTASAGTAFAGTAPAGADLPRPFAFLSVFKWEERKGWRSLLRAFLEEFDGTAGDEVALYLRVSTDGDNKQQASAKCLQLLPQKTTVAVGGCSLP